MNQDVIEVEAEIESEVEAAPALPTLESLPIVYSPTRNGIESLRAKHAALKINGPEDKKGYKAVDDARKHVKKMLASVEARRKELKSVSLKYGKRIDESAEEITRELTKERVALEAKLAPIDAAKEAAKAAAEKARKQKTEDRIAELEAIGQRYSPIGVEHLSDQQFANMVAELKRRQQVEDAAREADRKRLEEAEADRKRLAEAEAELVQLRADKARREAEVATNVSPKAFPLGTVGQFGFTPSDALTKEPKLYPASSVFVDISPELRSAIIAGPNGIEGRIEETPTSSAAPPVPTAPDESLDFAPLPSTVEETDDEDELDDFDLVELNEESTPDDDDDDDDLGDLQFSFESLPDAGLVFPEFSAEEDDDVSPFAPIDADPLDAIRAEFPTLESAWIEIARLREILKGGEA